MAIRPETKVPDTGTSIDKAQVDAEVAHERTLEYFVHNTELGVLDKDQMGVIALVDAGQILGLQLPATAAFFEKIRELSSGEEGKGRVQVKEVITAGAFPMSLLFGEKKSGLLDTLKGFLGKGNNTEQKER
jgi:hypothetical protein